MFTSRARRFAAGTLMVAGLALIAAPLSASAHTGKLFTWAEEDVDDETTVQGFAEFSQTTAAMTFLGAQEETDLHATGADVCSNEEAWGVGYVSEPAVLYTWNHDTGELSLPAPPSVTNMEFFIDATSIAVNQVWSADSLADCTKLAFVEVRVSYEQGDDQFYVTLSYVNPSNGDVTIIMTMPPEGAGESELRWHGIATNPLTGATYLFFTADGDPAVVQAFLDPPDLGAGLMMTNLLDFFEDDGDVVEADFQPDGTLWMTYEVGFDDGSDYRLLKFAPGANLIIDDPTDVGPVNFGPDGVYSSYPEVVTYDPFALPATGPAPVGLLAVGGALLLGGFAIAAVGTRIRRA